MQASLWKELKLSISIKCFPKSLITFYNRKKDCFYVSSARKRQTGCSKSLFCLGMFLLLLPHSGSLEYVCRAVVFFCLSRHLKRGRVARESFIFTVCLANDLQANTAIIQDHIFFQVHIEELMYSSFRGIDYIFHLQIVL